MSDDVAYELTGVRQILTILALQQSDNTQHKIIAAKALEEIVGEGDTPPTWLTSRRIDRANR